MFPVLVIWAATVVAQENVAALVLRISPADALVTIDDKPVQLAERGAAALARLVPGKHVLVVMKDGHVPLRKIVDLPAEGLEARVQLAPMLRQVTVQLKSGRVMSGGLVAQEDDSITITRGRGKLKLRKSQYEKLSITSEARVGESTFEIVERKEDGEPAAPPLPKGSVRDQFAALREAFESCERLLKDACRVHGARSTEVRKLEERQRGLRKQAAEFAPRMGDALAAAEKLHTKLKRQGLPEGNAVVLAAATDVDSWQALLDELNKYLPQKRSGRRRGRGIVSRALRKAFVLPDGDRDQHGNPVVERDGRRCDNKTRWAYEVWLTEPRMEFVLIDGSQSGRFYISKYEVTRAQYSTLMAENPSKERSETAPVMNVSLTQAKTFCGKLSLKAKRSVRLPTAKEWEHAARAGAKGKFLSENGPSELGDYAWYRNNSGSKPHPVGTKQPNAWGLYDVLGNVREWCSVPKENSAVMCGGTYVNSYYWATLSTRNAPTPGQDTLAGIRCLLEIPGR